MRSAERELTEIERKQSDILASKAKETNSDQDKAKLLKNATMEWSRKLSNIRSQMKTLGGKPSSTAKGVKSEPTTGTGAISVTSTKTSNTTSSSSGGSGPSANKSGGPGKKSAGFPDSVVPALCKYVLENATLGLEAFKSGFTTIHPEIAKRQVEMKIQELFLKKGKTYVFRDGMEHKLDAGAGASSTAKKAPVKRERDPNDKPAPRRSKVTTAFLLFVKDQKKATEKGLAANDDYVKATSDEKMKLVKETLSKVFQELSDEKSASYEASAKAKNDESNEIYSKAMAEWEKEQKAKRQKTEATVSSAASATNQVVVDAAMDVAQS